MKYAIMRHNKLTSVTKLASVEKHNMRTMNVPNSQIPNATKRLLGDGSTIPQLVNERLKSEGVKVNKNSVLAVEILLTASPSFFEATDDCDDVMGGKWSKERVVEWYEKTKWFLFKKYGDNLVAVDLHLDEKSPHLHAIVTPIAKKQRKLRGKDVYVSENRLDAKNMFNPSQLRKSQTEYHRAVESLGLSRGVKGSKKKHLTLKQHRENIENQPLESSLEHFSVSEEESLRLKLASEQRRSQELLNALEHFKHKCRELESKLPPSPSFENSL
jgi:hypothetical protein